MHPGNAARDIGIFDAVAIFWIIEHDFAGSAAILRVYLEEDGGLGTGDADAVFGDEVFDDDGVQE